MEIVSIDLIRVMPLRICPNAGASHSFIENVPRLKIPRNIMASKKDDCFEIYTLKSECVPKGLLVER